MFKHTFYLINDNYNSYILRINKSKLIWENVDKKNHLILTLDFLITLSSYYYIKKLLLF